MDIVCHEYSIRKIIYNLDLPIDPRGYSSPGTVHGKIRQIIQERRTG
jgi:hypothetical protein